MHFDNVSAATLLKASVCALGLFDSESCVRLDRISQVNRGTEQAVELFQSAATERLCGDDKEQGRV